MRKLLLLVGLSMLGTMMLASVVFAQSGVNLQEDPGDNIDPQTGEVVGDDTPDCASSEDVLESGLCRPNGSSSASPSPGINTIAESCNDQPDPAGCKRQLRGAEGFGSATPSATSSATASAITSATATASSALPATGGPVSLVALVPLALLAGSGILAFGLVRRR